MNMDRKDYIIVKTNWRKYGVIYLKELSDTGTNTVHFRRNDNGLNVSLSELSVVENDTITDKDVYNANYWKCYLSDRSMYIPITDQHKYKSCYERVYANEIEERIKSLIRSIELCNKGRKYEELGL